ncbi:hypothetical protein [Caenimonas soli]|uniref:hypothetical protein n=1 Tax=Caenimonas soli TaxID=2735555 RepID=UPI001553F2ED|nr:hypothetical protein [Caenimonas soli]NPC59394.1 hypothetical protein [Caenimonas soli]
MPKFLEIAKVVGSLLVGGLAGGAVFAAATMFVTYVPAGGTPQHSFVPSNLMWTPFFAIFSVPVALVVGVPLFFVLRRFSVLGWFSVALVGVLASLLSAALLGLYRNSIEQVILFGIAGLAAGVAAYAVLLRSNISLNPDARQERPRAG